MVVRGAGVGGLGEKGEGIKNYRLEVTEESQGCGAQQEVCAIIL